MRWIHRNQKKIAWQVDQMLIEMQRIIPASGRMSREIIRLDQGSIHGCDAV